MNHFSIAPLIPSLLTLVERAAERILQVYDKPVEVFTKTDGSPVTWADHQSHLILKEGLESLAPDIPVISEEDQSSWTHKSPLYWLVDPLDGTRGFISKNGEFCINIALMENDRPFFGLIHEPLTRETFYGYAGKAWCYQAGITTAIHTRPPSPQGITLLSGGGGKTFKAQAAVFFKDTPIVKVEKIQSALKFCSIARGDADFYLRFEECCEWDTAAGHALVEAAGGTMTNLDGSLFLYGKPDLLNQAFVVSGAKSS